jgi:hypothetical protein
MVDVRNNAEIANLARVSLSWLESGYGTWRQEKPQIEWMK